MLAAALAVLGAAVVASPAFAFDHHFSVLGKAKSFHRAGQNAFVFKEKLLDPNNRHNQVGRDRGRCRGGRHKIKCHVHFHLNGKIGGFGDIRVRGDLDPGPDHLVVLGGSDDFDGVAGKVTVRAIEQARRLGRGGRRRSKQDRRRSGRREGLTVSKPPGAGVSLSIKSSYTVLAVHVQLG